jgi:hypothetical protein
MMKTTPRILGFWLLAVGCGESKQEPVDDDSSGTTQGGSDTGAPTSGESESESESSGDTTDTGCSFFQCETTGMDPPPPAECDQWKQDCGPGKKCSAYADDGSFAWNNTKCVDVYENAGVPGDECTVEGSGVSGVDSCAKGAMCWDVDGETGKGVCVPLCLGSPEAPICELGQACAVNNDVLNLCLSSCDPLAMDCDGDDLCLPSGEGFLCVLDASGMEGQAFDPCEFGNACDAGLYCFDPAYGSECNSQAGGCCLPFCDTTDADCPGQGQTCIPWYEPGSAPPGFDTVGFCGIPQ